MIFCIPTAMTCGFHVLCNWTLTDCSNVVHVHCWRSLSHRHYSSCLSIDWRLMGKGDVLDHPLNLRFCGNERKATVMTLAYTPCPSQLVKVQLHCLYAAYWPRCSPFWCNPQLRTMVSQLRSFAGEIHTRVSSSSDIRELYPKETGRHKHIKFLKRVPDTLAPRKVDHFGRCTLASPSPQISAGDSKVSCFVQTDTLSE
jgi:hypothetical protein